MNASPAHRRTMRASSHARGRSAAAGVIVPHKSGQSRLYLRANAAKPAQRMRAYGAFEGCSAEAQRTILAQAGLVGRRRLLRHRGLPAAVTAREPLPGVRGPAAPRGPILLTPMQMAATPQRWPPSRSASSSSSTPSSTAATPSPPRPTGAGWTTATTARGTQPCGCSGRPRATIGGPCSRPWHRSWRQGDDAWFRGSSARPCVLG